MTPVSRDQRIMELEQQISELSATKDRHDSHMRRTMKYYDEAPDGSQQKHDAVTTMNSISDKVHVIERKLSALVDELESLGY